MTATHEPNTAVPRPRDVTIPRDAAAAAAAALDPARRPARRARNARPAAEVPAAPTSIPLGPQVTPGHRRRDHVRAWSPLIVNVACHAWTLRSAALNDGHTLGIFTAGVVITAAAYGLALRPALTALILVTAALAYLVLTQTGTLTPAHGLLVLSASVLISASLAVAAAVSRHILTPGTSGT